jgi:hypothetical protein
MTHTKIIIRIFMLIGVFDVFAFGQQNRLFQNIFDITNNPVGVEILNPEPDYQTMEITEDIAYQELLRLISSFEKQADKQLKEGYAQRANFLRSFLQREAGLTLEQANVLKADALNFTTRFGCRTNSDTVINQTENFDSEKLDRERNQILKQYRNRFRQLLGESVNKFDRFVQEKIASRLIYTKDLETRNAYFGFSMVDYDYQSNEVIGYSYTEEPPGHCEVIENIVLATLSSDTQGVVDYDYAEMCDGRAEVYLYYSNPQPEDRFCVDGEHYFVRVFGLPFNDSRRKSNRVLCPSGKIEALPSSEDCLTTPPLPNVTSVSFDLIEMGNTGIDTNPNVGGGQRIFPDKDTPGDMVNRQQIKVTAQLSENRAGVRVYFENFDLDDPTDDPIIDPNDDTGDDNNGQVNGNTAGHLSAPFAETNGNGEASVIFTVTRQPGDNFAIAAGVDSDAVSEVTVSGIDLTRNGTSIETNCDGTDLVCRSPMLTVWRRLHIEVDSMGIVQQNLVSGIIPDETRVRRNTSATITLEPLNNEPMEVNRFENGRLALGSSSLEVTSNTETTVTVFNNNQPTVYAPANSLFHLYDDDDFNDNDGTNLIGDIGEDIPLRDSDLVLLSANSDDQTTNVLAPVYIRPVYDVDDPNDNSFFQANADGLAQDDTRALFVDRDLRNTNMDVEFWTVYVLGAYQSAWFIDNDPAFEHQHSPVYGIADGIPTTMLGDGSGVAIFQESHNSKEIVRYPNDPADPSLRRVATTVAHEIGHLLSGQHGDGSIMTDGIGVLTSSQFSPTTIRRIRALLTHP